MGFSEMVGIKRTERICALAVTGARLCLEWRGGRSIKRLRRIQRIVGFVMNSARVCWRSWGGRGIRRITRNERVWGGLSYMTLVCVCGSGAGVVFTDFIVRAYSWVSAL